jgi:ubiquinone biosynthesis protein
MLQTALVATRDRKRLSEILSVLGRHGLGSLLARFGLPAPASERDEAISGLSEAARLRLSLEALGPTFVKLGQILSTRGDLLPPEWIAELEKLQSAVAPEPWERARPRLEEALGGPVETVFARFDATPIASGSIAQVYRAALRGEDGALEEVVVKLRREGLRPRIEADMRLLSHAAAVAEAKFDAARRNRLVEIVAALSASLREELDFSNEGRNAERIARNVASESVVVPRVRWSLSGEDVLVMDFLEGAPARDADVIKALGLDRKRLAERGAKLFVEMILRDGEFHADPHPGNMRLMSGDRIGLIDFGAIGVVSPRRRREMLTLLAALVAGDAEKLAAILLDWNLDAQVDPRALEADAAAFARRHAGAKAGLAAMVSDFLALMRGRDLAVPPDLALLLRALVSADAAVRAVDPDINLIEAATPHVRRLMLERYRPDAVGGRLASAFADLEGLVEEAPSLIRSIGRLARRGKVSAQIDVVGLERLGAAIERGAMRLSVAVVAAAVALALGPYLLSAGPTIGGAPAAAIVGGVGLAGLILWLVVLGRGR